MAARFLGWASAPRPGCAGGERGMLGERVPRADARIQGLGPLLIRTLHSFKLALHSPEADTAHSTLRRRVGALQRQSSSRTRASRPGCWPAP